MSSESFPAWVIFEAGYFSGEKRAPSWTALSVILNAAAIVIKSMIEIEISF